MVSSQEPSNTQTTPSGSPVIPYREVQVANETYKVSVSMRTAREIMLFTNWCQENIGDIDSDAEDFAEHFTDELLMQYQDKLEAIVGRVLRRYHEPDEIEDLLDIAMMWELFRLVNGLSTDEEWQPNFTRGQEAETLIQPSTTPTI